MQRNAIYKKKQWYEVREKVLELDHHECQRCNHNVFKSDKPKCITRATLVHHIYYADKYPQYKYSIWVNGHRNLVSLCNDCHEALHDRKWHPARKNPFLTEERYD